MDCGGKVLKLESSLRFFGEITIPNVHIELTGEAPVLTGEAGSYNET